MLRVLRGKASAERKSLNAWLRDLLSREAEKSGDWFEEYRRVVAEIGPPVEKFVWNRDEIYEERAKRFR